MSQPYKILSGMLLGAVLGILAHVFIADTPLLEFMVSNVARPMGQLFLRLIFMIVVPLVFSVLVLGIYELGDSRMLGRIGIKTLIYTAVATVISVLIGLVLVETFRPGSGLQGMDFRSIGVDLAKFKAQPQVSSGPGLIDAMLDLIPKNPLGAAVRALDGDIMALMVFAAIFGTALVLVRGQETKDPLVACLETMRDTCMKIVEFAMAVAPFGIGGLMFAITANFGWMMLINLGKYVLVVLGGLAIQQLVVYSIILKFFAGRSPMDFLRQIREVMILAFSTASSNATLPTSIRVTQQNLKVDEKISSFVLTVGAAANQNGTALFEGVTILFLAQVFGIDLSLSQQVTVLFMAVAAGIGTAGVPAGSIPMIVVVMQAVGIPAEGIGIVLGVDRVLDMSRTVLNVSGDIVAACVVDYSEKKRNNLLLAHEGVKKLS